MRNSPTDLYLGRLLKNWAAGRRPASDQRTRLLRAAALEQEGVMEARPALFSRWLARLRKPEYSHEMSNSSFTQSEYFSFQLATAARIAF